MKATCKPRQFHVVDQQPPSEGHLNDTIDPRSPDEEGTTRPIKCLVNLPVDDKEPSKLLKIGKNLPEEIRGAISEFLRKNMDVFRWAHSNMEGINPSIMSHRLNIDLSRKPVQQKRWAIDAERY